MGEIKITYETLFDVLRRERSREELQKLDDTFFEDVAEYLKEKKAILEQSSDQSELFKASEAEKTRIQLHNIRKILKELYEARERKIINRAVNKVKTGSEMIDTSAFLIQEQSLFQDMADILAKYRQEILIGLVNGDAPKSRESEKITAEHESETLANEPEVVAPTAEVILEPTVEEKKPEDEPTPEVDEKQETPKEEEPTKKNEEEDKDAQKEELKVGETSKEESSESSESSTIQVKFLHSLPRFVGKNQEVFGPFAQDETISLPEEIANILIKKGRAEKITL